MVCGGERGHGDEVLDWWVKRRPGGRGFLGCSGVKVLDGMFPFWRRDF